MLRVTVATSSFRAPAKTISADTTVGTVIDEFRSENGIPLLPGWTIAGETLDASDLDKTFLELGYDEQDITMVNISKPDNA